MRADRALSWLRRRARALGARLRSPPAEDPWLGLLPPLARPSFPGWQRAAVAVALLATGGAVLWPLPARLHDHVLGGPDAPGDLPAWMTVARRGGSVADLALVPDANFPVGADVVVREGWPLAAVVARPLASLVGAPGWINLGAWLWLAAMGWGAAWLGGRWWNDPRGAFASGVGYQACAIAGLALAEARLGAVAALALLPFALGLWVRALDRGTWAAAALAGAAVAGLALADAAGAAWFAVAALPPLLVALAARRWEAAWVAGTGALTAALAGVAVPLAWAIANRPLLPGALAAPDAARLVDGRWVSAFELAAARGLLAGGDAWLAITPLAVVVGLLGAALAPGGARRVAYPLGLALLGALLALGPLANVGADAWFLPHAALLGVPGLGAAPPLGFLALAELGLALLAGGLAVGIGAWAPLRGPPPSRPAPLAGSRTAGLGSRPFGAPSPAGRERVSPLSGPSLPAADPSLAGRERVSPVSGPSLPAADPSLAGREGISPVSGPSLPAADPSLAGREGISPVSEPSLPAADPALAGREGVPPLPGPSLPAPATSPDPVSGPASLAFAALALAVPVTLLARALLDGPLPTTPWPDSAAIAGAPGTPVLALPYPSATGATVTWDQLAHGRPLVNGRTAPGGAGADPATAALHQRFPALDELARLGGPGPIALDRDDLAALRGLGVDRVYVDVAAYGPDAERARAQLQALEPVTGPLEEAGRYRVIRLPMGSGAAPSLAGGG